MQLLRYISEVLHTIGKPTRLLLNIKEHDLSQTRLSYTPMCIHTHTHNTLTSTPTTPSSTLPQRTHMHPYPHPQHPHIHTNHTLIHTSSTHPCASIPTPTTPSQPHQPHPHPHFLNAPICIHTHTHNTLTSSHPHPHPHFLNAPMCIHTHTHNTLTSTPTTPSSTLPQRTHVLPYPYPHPQHPHIHINHTLIHTSSTHPPVPAELATVPAHFLNAPTNAPTRPCRACSPTTALVALLSRVACGSIRSDTLEENTLEEIH